MNKVFVCEYKHKHGHKYKRKRDHNKSNKSGLEFNRVKKYSNMHLKTF